MESGNAVDQKGGPGSLFTHLIERFRPEAVYGNPTRRQVFMIVDLPTEADSSELMYTLTWAVGIEPTFTPIMNLTQDIYEKVITNAMKAPAIGRPWA